MATHGAALKHKAWGLASPRQPLLNHEKYGVLGRMMHPSFSQEYTVGLADTVGEMGTVNLTDAKYDFLSTLRAFVLRTALGSSRRGDPLARGEDSVGDPKAGVYALTGHFPLDLSTAGEIQRHKLHLTTYFLNNTDFSEGESRADSGVRISMWCGRKIIILWPLEYLNILDIQLIPSLIG